MGSDFRFFSVRLNPIPTRELKAESRHLKVSLINNNMFP